jgi:hypothetical protein
MHRPPRSPGTIRSSPRRQPSAARRTETVRAEPGRTPPLARPQASCGRSTRPGAPNSQPGRDPAGARTISRARDTRRPERDCPAPGRPAPTAGRSREHLQTPGFTVSVARFLRPPAPAAGHMSFTRVGQGTHCGPGGGRAGRGWCDPVPRRVAPARGSECVMVRARNIGTAVNVGALGVGPLAAGCLGARSTWPSRPPASSCATSTRSLWCCSGPTITTASPRADPTGRRPESARIESPAGPPSRLPQGPVLTPPTQ